VITNILRRVVNYIKSASHYMASIFTNVSWYEYDDLKLKRIQVLSTKYMVMPHVLICTNKIKQSEFYFLVYFQFIFKFKI